MKSDKHTPNSIAEIRVNKGYSIKEVATLLSVPSSRVEQWEQGAVIPSAIHLLKLCALLETSIEFLYPEIYKNLLSDE